MINNKVKLKEYIESDWAHYGGGKPSIKDYILHNEKWFIYYYMVALRHVEYYINTQKRGARYLFWWIIYKRLGFKLKFTIYPNTCEEGLAIYHCGDLIWIKQDCTIGKNCVLRPGVVIGEKYTYEKECPVSVGDNVDFGLGVRVFGSLRIGNNVTVGANSVITKDIPDNVVVGGIPAKIIKQKVI